MSHAATPDEVDQYRMSLLEHLVELRNRLMTAGYALLVALGICLPFGDEIFHFLRAPAMAHMPAGSSFQYTQVAEQFITNLKVGLFAALFLAAPVIFAQFWGFVAPGLYRHERKLVLPFVVLSSVFFAAGAAFCYYMVLPWGMNFFLSMGSEEVQANIRVAEYLSFVTKFILGFGIIFEMPLAIFFLARAGIVDHEGLARFRRYAVVLSFVVAMLLTPPDPGTQIALAIPMVLLYEVGVLTARLWGRPKPKAPAEAPSVDTRPKGPPE